MGRPRGDRPAYSRPRYSIPQRPSLARGGVITGVETRRVENDAGTYTFGFWADADGAIYPQEPPATTNAGRVRFSTHDSGTAIPAGATITGLTLRTTLGTGDLANRTFIIREFTTAGSLNAVVTLATLATGVVILDDLNEQTVVLPVPASWSAANIAQSCLQFELSDPEFGTAVMACSLNEVSYDMYVDIAWEKQV